MRTRARETCSHTARFTHAISVRRLTHECVCVCVLKIYMFNLIRMLTVVPLSVTCNSADRLGFDSDRHGSRTSRHNNIVARPRISYRGGNVWDGLIPVARTHTHTRSFNNHAITRSGSDRRAHMALTWASLVLHHLWASPESIKLWYAHVLRWRWRIL